VLLKKTKLGAWQRCFCFFSLFLLLLLEVLKFLRGKSLIDFSPDGSKIVLADYERSELWIFDLTANKREKIISLQSKGNQKLRLFSPRFSPDGLSLSFVSFDENQTDPKEGKIWHVNIDGSGFRLFQSIHLIPGFPALKFPSFLHYRANPPQLYFHNYDLREKTPYLLQVEIDGGKVSPFLGDKGVIFSNWSQDSSQLAMVVQSPGQGQISMGLWLTQKDREQSEKVSSHLYFPSYLTQPSFSWSYDFRNLTFFSEKNDKNQKPFRELEVKFIDKESSQAIYRTRGQPIGPPRISRSQKRLAFLESKHRESPYLNLHTFSLKWKDRIWHPAKIISSRTFPKKTVLLGWDHKEPYYYLLMPNFANDKKFYSLVRHHSKREKKKIILRHLPPQLVYYFREKENEMYFCGKLEGCQKVSLPQGKPQWLLPNIESIFSAGDFQFLVGDYVTSRIIYHSVNETILERKFWIDLMARRYLVNRRIGAERPENNQDRIISDRIWSSIHQRIFKGEEPASEFLRFARVLDELRDYQTAIDLYQKILEKYRHSLEARTALLLMGEVYRKRGEYDYAENSFANFAKLYPDDHRAGLALIEYGETLLLKDEPGKSIKVFRKVIIISQNENYRVRAYLGKARSLEKMNRFKEAKKTYQLVLNRENQNKNNIDGEYFDQAKIGLKRMEKSEGTNTL